MLLPFETNAAAHARCIELLEAGACMVPSNEDGFIVACINICSRKVIKDPKPEKQTPNQLFRTFPTS
jgi:hypothetical protein